MNFIHKLVLCATVLGMSHAAFSQSASLSAGGDASGGGGSVSYSVGQIDYSFSSSNDGVLTWGVQQPYELFEIIGVAEWGGKYDISVFPNPASKFIQLNIAGHNGDLSLRMFDALGQLVRAETIRAAQTQINLSDLSNGMYYLKLYNKSGVETNTIKVIKTH